jgi:hypothetical protein
VCTSTCEVRRSFGEFLEYEDSSGSSFFIVIFLSTKIEKRRFFSDFRSSSTKTLKNRKKCDELRTFFQIRMGVCRIKTDAHPNLEKKSSIFVFVRTKIQPDVENKTPKM